MLPKTGYTISANIKMQNIKPKCPKIAQNNLKPTIHQIFLKLHVEPRTIVFLGSTSYSLTHENFKITNVQFVDLNYPNCHFQGITLQKFIKHTTA